MKNKSKGKRGQNAQKTRALQKRYTGFFKTKYIRMELVPYLILSGMSHVIRTKLDDILSIDAVASILNRNPHNDLSLVKQELIDYVNHEVPFIKKYSADRILNLLRIGATLLENKRISEGIQWQKAHKIIRLKHKPNYGKLLRYILNGESDIDWYEQTRIAFEEFLPGYNTELFVKVFALTSPRANFASNIRLALKAYDMFTDKSEFQPDGFLGSTFSILRQFHDGDFVFTENLRGSKRKVNSFAHSILGYDHHATVDMWVGIAFALVSYYLYEGERYPYTIRDSEYDAIEVYLKGLATVTGFQAKQINAMIWLGIRMEEYEKHSTTSTAILLQKALRRHPDLLLRENALGKIIMPPPIHTTDNRVECLDYEIPLQKRVHLVKDSKPGSVLYRVFDGEYHKYCSNCSHEEGCKTCTLP